MFEIQLRLNETHNFVLSQDMKLAYRSEKSKHIKINCFKNTKLYLRYPKTKTIQHVPPGSVSFFKRYLNDSLLFISFL